MKCLLKFAVICVLALLLLVGAVFLGLESLLTEGIKAGVHHATGQETALEGVDIEFTDKGLGFRGLEIANPPGFQETPLFKIGTIHASMQPEVVRGQVVLVNDILFDGMELALELKGADSNVNALMKRLAELQGDAAASSTPKTDAPAADTGAPQSTTTTAPSPTADATPKTQISIRRIQISGFKASLRISDVPTISGIYSVTIPDIVLEDLDSSMSEADLSVWTAYILDVILQRALAAGNEVFPGEWQKIFQSELANTLLKGDFKGAGKELEKQAEAELDKLKEGAQGTVQDALDEGQKTLDKAAEKLDAPKNALEQLQKDLKKGAELKKDFFKKD